MMMASFSLKAGMSLVAGWLAHKVPLAAEKLPWLAPNGISMLLFLLLGLLFFKVLPDTKIPWTESISGAMLSIAPI